MKFKSSSTQLYLISTIFLALVLRLIALDQSFWLDEAAQALLSQNPFNIMQFATDFQPPLFYILTHYWMKLGATLGTQAEWFLRLLPVMFGVATVYVLYKLVEKLFGKKSALLSSLLLATAPFHVYYSQEFRMYSMLTFISVLSWYLLVQKRWKSVGVLAFIGVFTHYFAFVHIAAQFLYVFFRQRKEFLTFASWTTLGLLPFIWWIPIFMQQLETAQQLIQAWPGWAFVSNAGFIRFPTLLLAKFTVGMISPTPRIFYVIAVGIFSVISWILFLAAVIMTSSKKVRRESVIILLYMSIAPILLAWFGGIVLDAASPWRIQFVLPAIYALMGVTIAWLYRAQKSTPVLIFAIYLLLSNFFFSYIYLVVSDNHRENWREAVAYTDEFVNEGAVVVSQLNGRFAPMEYYTKHPEAYIAGFTTQRATEESVAAALSGVQENTVIVYRYLYELSDPERYVQQYLLENGYVLKNARDFRGVGIVEEYRKQ